MSIITVNEKKCTSCWACVEECPIYYLIKGEKTPIENSQSICIACGHCVAVCPVSAIDNSKNKLSTQIVLDKFPVINDISAKNFIRSRRSIRNFKDKLVSKDLIEKLLDIARYAQTGGNSQGLSYIVVNGKEKTNEISRIIVNWMKEQMGKGLPLEYYFNFVVNTYNNFDKNVVLRGAPHLVIAYAGKDNVIAKQSVNFSLGNVELYATTLNLGTCWAGFFDFCAQAHYEPLMEYLGINSNENVLGALMLGYPKYSYKRLVERNPISVKFI